MADALKEMFNKKFYEQLGLEFQKVDKNFHPGDFVRQVTKNLEPLSLNQRLRNTTLVLNRYLPRDFKRAVDILEKVAPSFQSSYTALVFPDFVGVYGHDHTDRSLEALKFLTQFGSSEFAIREYLKRDFKKTIRVMETWASDKNYHVRRLASEGSRGRLPWSFTLDEVMKDPKTTRSILEQLKTDPELYVKKSVANHLNDFSKKHAPYMLEVMNSWDKSNVHTAWIIKHASRTLIKSGHLGSLAVFDFEKNAKVELMGFKIKKAAIRLGESLEFDFDIRSQKNRSQKLVVDYKIHYRKKSGEVSPKVFKLKEVSLQPGKTVHISKTQRFQDFTTRKHYPGKHYLEIVINGKSYLKKEFKLIG